MLGLETDPIRILLSIGSSLALTTRKWFKRRSRFDRAAAPEQVPQSQDRVSEPQDGISVKHTQIISITEFTIPRSGKPES